MSERVTVRRGQVFCPRCDAPLTGYVDVTAHPTVHVRRGGALRSGRLLDSKAALARQAADHVFLDVLVCSASCGFEVQPPALRDQFRSGAERAIAAAFAPIHQPSEEA